jgi:hypothetical protein
MSGIKESELANRLRPYWLNDTARGSYSTDVPVQIGVRDNGGTVYYAQTINLIGDGVTFDIATNPDDDTQVDVTITAAGGSSSYDYGDGLKQVISNGAVMQFYYQPVLRAFDLGQIRCYSPDTDGITFEIKRNGTAVVTVVRASSAWTVNTVSAGSTDGMLYAFVSPIPFAAGDLLETILTASADLTALGYSFGPS